MFIAILLVSAYLNFQGRLTLSALGAAAVIVFVGINATEIHRIWQTYEINPRSVVHTKGYLSRHSRRIDLFAINDVTITQSLFQRIFNIGDVHIRIANASYQTILTNVHNPKSFAQTIERNMHGLRNIGEDGPDRDYPNTKQPFKRPTKDNLSDDFDGQDNENKEESDAEISKRLREI